MVSTQILLESGLLFALRTALLSGCRKYLLRAVYSDLKTLSEDVELLELPTHTPKPGFAAESALHSRIARTIFSWTFSECCMMFVLLVIQGMNILTGTTRLLNWHFSLTCLVALVLAIIPSCISVLLSMGKDHFSIRNLCGPRAAAHLMLVFVYLLALSYIPLPSGLHSSSLSANILSRLIVLGTVILGILSGFGAVNNSWSHLPLLSKKHSIPTDAEIQAAEYTLTSIRNDLDRRRQQIQRTSSTEIARGSWIARVGATFRGGDELSQEIKGLESLEYQMSKNIETLRSRRDSGDFSATWRGRLWNVAGRVFAIYCITRIFGCLYNVVFLPAQRSTSNVNYSDLLSSVLAVGVSHLSPTPVPTEDIASFSRQLSLALVGLIIVTSVRYILRGVARVLRVSSRSLGTSLMLLLLAQIMGIYLLSTVVQMRASFPPSQSSAPGEVNLFSTIPEYELFGSLFDWTFLLTALATCLVRWGAEKVNGLGDD